MAPRGDLHFTRLAEARPRIAAVHGDLCQRGVEVGLGDSAGRGANAGGFGGGPGADLREQVAFECQACLLYTS